MLAGIEYYSGQGLEIVPARLIELWSFSLPYWLHCLDLELDGKRCEFKQSFEMRHALTTGLRFILYTLDLLIGKAKKFDFMANYK